MLCVVCCVFYVLCCMLYVVSFAFCAVCCVLYGVCCALFVCFAMSCATISMWKETKPNSYKTFCFRYGGILVFVLN